MRFNHHVVIILASTLGVNSIGCVDGLDFESADVDTLPEDDAGADTDTAAATSSQTGDDTSATAASETDADASDGTTAPESTSTSASTSADSSDTGADPLLDVLDRIDCGENGEHFPLCGGSSNFALEEWNPNEVEFEFMPGAGPSGRWAVEFHHQPTTTGADEIYFGWNRAKTNGCDIAQGESCVVRWWFQTVSPEQTGQFGAKLFILGDNDGDDANRIIGTWREWCEGSCYTFDVDKNIDGIGPNFIDPTPDTWHSVQVVIQSSSTAESADGSLAIYLDTDDEATPTDVRTGLVLPATWNKGGWGFGMFRNSDEDGEHVRYRIYCVELARSFDGNYGGRTSLACAD